MDLIYIRSLFEPSRDDSNAFFMKKYMKNQFEFLGIKTPLRRELTRLICNNDIFKELPAKDLQNLALALWNEPFREYQYLAMDLLDRRIKKSGREMVELLEYLIVTKAWWDTVDMIASHLVGSIFLNYPDLIESYVPRWMESGNIWLQRTALLFQLKYGLRTNDRLLFENCRRLSGSREFFIQKAIGWALREYSKVNPVGVREFVSHNELAPLSKREALRKIFKNTVSFTSS